MTTKGPSESGSNVAGLHDSASARLQAITMQITQRWNKSEDVRSYAVHIALTIYTTQPPWVEDGNQTKSGIYPNEHQEYLRKESKPNAAS